MDWRKDEKAIYLPGQAPVEVDVPEMGFFEVAGSGDPNGEFFAGCLTALYSLAYAVKMSPKSGEAPVGYEPYSVYPLEGVWDVSEAAKSRGSFPGGAGGFDKSLLVFRVMIRQPDFVDAGYAAAVIERVAARKPIPALELARYVRSREGRCVQALHVGSYDSEAATFARMEEFCAANGLARASATHREIYLSDPGRAAEDKLKTVLRFRVEPDRR